MTRPFPPVPKRSDGHQSRTNPPTDRRRRGMFGWFSERGAEEVVGARSDMQENALNLKDELQKAQQRLQRRGFDLAADLPDFPVAVVLPKMLPTRGNVHIGLNRVSLRDHVQKRFKSP